MPIWGKLGMGPGSWHLSGLPAMDVPAFWHANCTSGKIVNYSNWRPVMAARKDLIILASPVILWLAQ